MKRLSVALLLIGLAGCDNSPIPVFNKHGYYQSCNIWQAKVSNDTNVRRWCRISEDRLQHLGYEERRDEKGQVLSTGIVKYFSN
jgi:hypothetical protein